MSFRYETIRIARDTLGITSFQVVLLVTVWRRAYDNARTAAPRTNRKLHPIAETLVSISASVASAARAFDLPLVDVVVSAIRIFAHGNLYVNVKSACASSTLLAKRRLVDKQVEHQKRCYQKHECHPEPKILCP